MDGAWIMILHGRMLLGRKLHGTAIWESVAWIGCITRLLLGQILIGAGRRLVELVELQDIASRRNNDVECIIKCFIRVVV
jgi:hypothetical protein